MQTWRTKAAWGILILVCCLLVGLRIPSPWRKSEPQIPEPPASTPVLPAQEALPDKTAPELILVNKSVRLGPGDEPDDLTPVRGVYLRKMAADALVRMLAGAKEAGFDELIAYSGYRSYATQADVYANKIASLQEEYKDKAEEMAQKLVAPPGSSEHQTGLALDMTLKRYLKKEYVLNYDFGESDEGQWLRHNAWKYGFVIRYDDDKEDVTHFSYEPWHFRYVGPENARKMYDRGVCLEEYLTIPQ